VEAPSLQAFKSHYQAAFLALCVAVLTNQLINYSINPTSLAARAAMPDVQRKVFSAYTKDAAIIKKLQLRMMEELDIVDHCNALISLC